jgi:NTP pyrophosphatase (non-canonical NTP hydrolase)
VGAELADVLIYAVRLADVAGIDLADGAGIDLDAAVRAKITNNAERYPADVVRGSATKHSDRISQPEVQ